MATNTDQKEAPEKIELPTEEPNVKVNLDEPDDDDKDLGREDETPPIERSDVEARERDQKTGQWTKKKQERSREHREQRTWERERADYDRRFRMMQEDHDRRFNELRTELDRSRQQNTGAPADPFTARIKEIDFQLDAELQLIESGERRDYARYRQLNDQRVELISQRMLAAHVAETQRQQQNRPEDAYAGRRPIIEAEFPWVMDRQYSQLAQRARTYKDYLVNFEGKPDTIDTDREALAHTVARHGGEYGLRPPPAPPSMRTRQMYAGPGTRNAPERNGRPREVELPRELVHGSGLSPERLARAVNAALNDEN
jgi:hypothetical protein